MPKQAEQAPLAATYSKEELISSQTFEPCRHFADALLKDDRRYTIDEAKRLVETFLGKAVK